MVGAATIAAAAIAATPAVAFAAPSTGSAGSSDYGINILDLGSSVIGSGSAGLLSRTQQCDESTMSGGEGVTETVHQLGRGGPTSFVLSYETYSVPDQIEVFYQGALIHSTGYIGDNINEGTGSAVINVPAGSETSVLVRVTGPNDTDWDYTVHCPIV
ncbi:hypothetical protein Rhow_002366 [Rhodococcus wratislaviensis]|uniref:Secreted protein n=1 Tax=Rhodococcus wratislaviensis TaxID=44752 RepID=A0A402C5M1_RHOWR|nr:hypothetical protein [Rhodococcus wratislaviensis]GCE38842.1 hypothetical protein Rhow_002366 [Rhodococcus wratislaviensis]